MSINTFLGLYAAANLYFTIPVVLFCIPKGEPRRFATFWLIVAFGIIAIKLRTLPLLPFHW